MIFKAIGVDANQSIGSGETESQPRVDLSIQSENRVWSGFLWVRSKTRCIQGLPSKKSQSRLMTTFCQDAYCGSQFVLVCAKRSPIATTSCSNFPAGSDQLRVDCGTPSFERFYGAIVTTVG